MLRPRANTASTLRVGSQPLSGTGGSRPRSFPSLSGNEAPKINLLENTKLHQAVANRQFEAIDNIVSLDPNIITIKNKQGETAADWFLEYLNNFFLLEEPHQMEQLPEKIKSGDITFVADYLEFGISPKLRFSDCNTLLHFAIQYNQIEIIQLILQYSSPELVSILLNMRNSTGVCPKELVTELGKKHPDILKSMLSSTHSNIQLSTKNTTTDFLPPQVTKIVLDNISEKLSKIKKESDFDKFSPSLEYLCQIAYFVCNQSIKILKKNENIFITSKKLLNPLFNGNFTTSDKSLIQENIQKISNYFKKIIQEDRVHQEIKLSTEKPYSAFTSKYRKIIYINPLLANFNLINLTLTLIHEVSHLILSNFDFKYCKQYEKHIFSFDFIDCLQLLDQVEPYKCRISEEGIYLLKIQHSLEGTKLPFNNWLAHRNADTFAVAVLGLAAFGWNCAEVEDSNLLINGNRFLTALSDYSYQLQPTTKPRSPDPPSETLLSPMASSDHPKNPNLLRKIRRIILKPTRKTPSIPRASSHASTAASSSPPQSPESDLNPKTFANLLTAGIVTPGIGEDRLSIFPPTPSTSPPDQIAATPDNLLKPGHHPGQLNFANRSRY
ncbi:MAG: hypothetical protein AB2990_01085 [Candidatus Symbiodolus clandestinus]